MSHEALRIHVTPNGDIDSSRPQLHPAEMRVVELDDHVIEVHDVLHAKPYRFGDRSLVTDSVADDYVVANWQHFGHLGSIRQLTNTETYETKPGTGRWSRAQHMLASAALTAMHGGSPLEIMQMASHDNGHRIGSHRTDDLVAGRGGESAHDSDLSSFMMRSGFIAALQQRGVVDPEGNFVNDGGAHISDVINLEGLPQGFINQPGYTRSLEIERAQYLAQEGAIWTYGPEAMREAVSHLHRVPDSVHGDHLVFDDVDAAIMFEKTQVRCFSEHWSEPVNDIIDELLMTCDKAILLSRHPDAGPYTGHAIGDVLYGNEEDWQELRLRVAEDIPVVAILEKVARRLAAQQREAHAQIDGQSEHYEGPILSDWVSLQPTLVTSDTNPQRTITGRSRNLGGNNLVLEMQPGKTRAINPWVFDGHGTMRRLEDVVPEMADYREKQFQWSGKPYDAVINLDHPTLGFKSAELRLLTRSLNRLHVRWPSAFARPAMSDELLQHRLQSAKEVCRKLGQIGMTDHALEAAS
jgi:hypothetical protein